MNALVARDLRMQLGRRQIVDGVSMALQPGELVLLAGRNGAGKSTLLRLLLGVLRPDAGHVELHGRALATWPAMARARELAFVSQEAETPFEFTGRELVTMGRHPHRQRSQPLQSDDLAAIERALVAVDAVPFADRPITTLSGGEQRRIAVARALATEAPLLLLDEPTSNLDLEHALQLAGLLHELAAAGRGILIASHDLNLLASRCDRVVLLHAGKVFADGEPEQALAAANVAAVFGVQSVPPSGFFPRDYRL
ncbi:MAG TPA: ABC transporter ATP-binding protein [Planctomycetota bacterium]|nr:ABC transporter ATP-binding protein [Planctomycetota bacterium]